MISLLLWCTQTCAQQVTEDYRDVLVPIDSNESFAGIKISSAVDQLLKLREFGKKYDSKGMENTEYGDLPERQNQILCGRSRGSCYFMYKGTTVKYDIATRQKTSVSFGQLDVAEKVTEVLPVRECCRRTQELYSFLLGNCELQLTDFFLETEGWVDLRFNQIVPGSNFAVGAAIEAVVDRRNGLPQLLTLSEPPKFVRCERFVSKEDAIVAALTCAKALAGWERVTIGVRDPRYRIPGFVKIPNAMTDKQRSYANENTACLIYEISVSDASSYNENLRRHDRVLQVFVDAETGRVIAATTFFKMTGDGNVSSSPMPAETKAWKCGNRSGELTPVREPLPKTGKAVTLRGPKGAVILGKYDEKSHRFFFKQPSEEFVGVPDKELELGMKEYKPSPYEKQPKLKSPQ